MRHLKFRAWDSAIGAMICTGFSIIGEVTVFGGLECMIAENPIKGLTGLDRLLSLKIMQFTGITDKNGKEYYFDDIIKTNQGIGVLVWFDDRFGISSGEIGNYHATDEISKYKLEKAEKLGNIYENPELL